MSRLEALKSYTINGAYATFEENIKGSIKVGKLADLVVLSKDLLKCSDDDIQKTKVLYTIVGGKFYIPQNKLATLRFSERCFFLDESFKLKDTFIGAGGISWIHRWAVTQGKKKEFFGDEPESSK